MQKLSTFLRRLADSLGEEMKHNALEPPKIPQPKEPEVAVPDKWDSKEYLQLHIQEYAALRSEQRTRLDSANKIIHYSAIVIAAVTAGLITLYKEVDIDKFNEAFRYVLLIFPVIALPFAFTQQNEEILVRRIGDYFSELKTKLPEADGSKYWNWENWHDKKRSLILHMTAFFRSGLLIIFSLVSIVIHLVHFGLPDSIIRWWLFAVDLVLLFGASCIALFMARKKLRKVYLTSE